MTLSEELAELNLLMQSELEHYRSRFGAYAFRMRHEQIGRSIVDGFWREGVESNLAPMVTLSPYLKTAYRVSGRAPFTVDLEVSAAGVPADSVLEFDRPPHTRSSYGSRPSTCRSSSCVRAPELVPGWMKVELAAVGAWDLRADVPTWKDLEPTGTPQTPESVGVPAPPGAERALPRG